MNRLTKLSERSLAVALLLLLPVANASAGPSGPWEPPEPDAKGLDWVQLNSGEWLAGSIQYLRLDQLEFDSKELGFLKFDWLDVAVVRSPRPNNCLFADNTTTNGTVYVDKTTAECGGKRTDRSRLRAIVPGEGTEAGYWSGKASFGLSAASGNTDQNNLNAYAQIKRDDSRNVLYLAYTGNFGNTDGERVTSNHRIQSGFYRDVSSRVYLVIPAFEFYNDRFKNIDQRYSLVAGIGFHLVREPKTQWTASAAAGWRGTTAITVVPGEEKTEDVGTLRFGTRFERDLTRKTDLTLSYTLQLAMDNASDNLHNFDAIFTAKTWGPFDVDFTFAWDRVNEPVPYADGTVPEKDDYRTTVGLSMNF